MDGKNERRSGIMCRLNHPTDVSDILEHYNYLLNEPWFNTDNMEAPTLVEEATYHVNTKAFKVICDTYIMWYVQSDVMTA
jgi:hypothetical protein